MYAWIIEFWPTWLAIAALSANFAAAAHAVLRRRDDRAALGWVALILMTPLVGALLYTIFGINRVRRRGARIRPRMRTSRLSAQHVLAPDELTGEQLPSNARHLAVLSNLVERLTGQKLVRGSEVRVLESGDEAFDAMLSAIDAARRSVTMSSYIFDADSTGLRFADALQRAHERGVQVRVLIDAVGQRYSWPRSMVRVLRERAITVAPFLPARAPWNLAHVNLRNHRKLLVCDGIVGFTGGINIRDAHRADTSPFRQALDVHFALRGPIVAQLQEAFSIDWRFATGEVLEGSAFFADPDIVDGPVIARGISDGPDEDVDVLPLVLIGAIGAATRSIRIVTPYFIPGQSLLDALCTAALGGVAVDIVIPRHPNLPWMTRAAMTRLEWLVARGCNVYLTPRPFDHAKLLTVDGVWTLIGSGNWDTRSLSLNFEHQVECYDPGLVATVDRLIDLRIGRADRLNRAFFENRGLGARLVDGTLRLFSPLL